MTRSPPHAGPPCAKMFSRRRPAADRLAAGRRLVSATRPGKRRPPLVRRWRVAQIIISACARIHLARFDGPENGASALGIIANIAGLTARNNVARRISRHRWFSAPFGHRGCDCQSWVRAGSALLAILPYGVPSPSDIARSAMPDLVIQQPSEKLLLNLGRRMLATCRQTSTQQGRAAGRHHRRRTGDLQNALASIWNRFRRPRSMSWYDGDRMAGRR